MNQEKERSEQRGVKITGDRRFGIAGGFVGRSYSTVSRAQWTGSAEKKERRILSVLEDLGLASGLITGL